MSEIRVRTDSRVTTVDITARVNDAIAKTKIESGLCNLFTLHTTAALIVSENWDPDVTGDLIRQLQKLVPRDAGYQHSEGNSQAHILSVMLGTSINIPVEHGKLKLGRWQGVMLAEFDGPRERTVAVTVIASR
ncbi:MAG: secondary thiamine-phosphate synthase enzyme YjbQ [Candidatus Binataceae bacterium]